MRLRPTIVMRSNGEPSSTLVMLAPEGMSREEAHRVALTAIGEVQQKFGVRWTWTQLTSRLEELGFNTPSGGWKVIDFNA